MVLEKLDAISRKQDALSTTLERAVSSGLHQPPPAQGVSQSICDILRPPAESIEELRVTSRRLIEEPEVKLELVSYFLF